MMPRKYTNNHPYFAHAVAARVVDLVNAGMTMTEIKSRFGYGSSVRLHSLRELVENPFGGWYTYEQALEMKKIHGYAKAIACTLPDQPKEA